MTVPSQENQAQVEQQKLADKELNFRNLEAKYQRQLEQERTARLEAERQLQERSRPPQQADDDDDDSEPYVDKKNLAKKLSKFEEKTKLVTQQEIRSAVQTAIQEEKKNNWLKSNPDFYDVLKQHAEKLAAKDPELAENILQMPEGFDRQKLVYHNIKALGLHNPEEKKPSIQDKVDANRKNPYYQPSGVGSAPYASVGDFSESGQKQAYDKMQQLKKQLRI